MTKYSRLTFIVIGTFAGVLTLCGGVVFAAGKISPNPSSATINEGSSQDVVVSLDAPIICPGGSPTCDITLAFNSTDPHVSALSALHWNAAEWTQTRTLTINTTSDGIYTGDRTVTLSATAVSNSVYYNNYVVTIPVTVIDLDPAPPAPGITSKTVAVTAGKNITVDVLTGVSGDPDPATLTITTPPKHGTAVDPPSTITYTPNTGYIGRDSLMYRVCVTGFTSICASATLNFVITAAAPDTGLPQQSPLAAIVLLGAGIGLLVCASKTSRTSE